MAAEDLLTLAEARGALKIPAGVTTMDADLQALYIPAVTAIVEDIIGPVVRRSFTDTVDGGSEAITLNQRPVAAITSVTEQGVVVGSTATTLRTNLAPNPIGALGSTTGLIAGGASLAGFPGYVRGTLTTATATNLAQYVANTNSAGSPYLLPCTPGVLYTASVEARTSNPGLSLGTLLVFYDATPTSIASQGGSPTPVSSTEFTRMAPIQAFAPAGAAYLMLRTGIAGTTPRSIGDTIDVRKFIVEAGTYNGGDYFDGDSPDTVSTDYAWTGTPGLSTSTQTTRVASGSYTADLSAGILYAGSPLATRCWLPGVDQVVVTYVAGRVADTASVPANVKMAARLILAHNYQADQQGFRPDLGSADGATQMTPSGYAIPRRAYAYLEPMSTTAVPSFA